MNLYSPPPPSYSSMPGRINEHTPLAHSSNTNRPHSHRPRGCHGPSSSQPAPTTDQDQETQQLLYPYPDHMPLSNPMQALCGLFIMAGIVSTIIWAINYGIGHISSPSLSPDLKTCYDYINNWENQIADLKREEDAARQRIEDFDQKLRERIERERRGREKEYLYWGDFHPAERCYLQGHRMYYAPLVGLEYPSSIDGIEVCKNMSVTINDIKYKTPSICEDRGSEQGVWGGWLASDEVSCTTYWEFVEDKGCTAPRSGLRRYQSKIGIVSKGEDPELLCTGAPLDINGMTYPHPLSCADWGIGFHGIWNIPDNEC